MNKCHHLLYLLLIIQWMHKPQIDNFVYTSKYISGYSGNCSIYRFDLCVVVQTIFSQLSAISWSFVASEGSLGSKHIIAVNPANV